MDTTDLVIPAMLGELWADASSVTFEEGWDATETLLAWIDSAAVAAGQPDALEVISGASASFDPATPSADRIHPMSDAELDEAEANAYVTSVLLCAAVMGAYLQSRSVFEFVAANPDDLTWVADLQDGEGLTARSLRALVTMCSSAASEYIAEFSGSLLHTALPAQPTVSSEFTFNVVGHRLFGAIHIWHELQAGAAAEALSVDRDHSGVQRMVIVARRPLEGFAETDDIPDEDWDEDVQTPYITVREEWSPEAVTEFLDEVRNAVVAITEAAGLDPVTGEWDEFDDLLDSE